MPNYTHEDFTTDGKFTYQPINQYWPSEDWFWERYDDLSEWFKPGDDFFERICDSCDPDVLPFMSEVIKNAGDNLHENTGKSLRGLIKRLYHHDILDLVIQDANRFADDSLLEADRLAGSFY